MSEHPTGVTPFEVLFDEVSGDGPTLPAGLAACYGAPWPLDTAAPQEVFLNFAASYDGRVSFGHPDWRGAGHISGFDRHDRWLMALLRARADVVVMGDGTLATDSDHLWTSEFIYPEDPEPFAALRAAEGRSRHPLSAFVSLSGRVPLEATVFAEPGIDIVLATTEAGAEAARADGAHELAEVVALGEERVDLPRLLRWLDAERGCRTVLCEGGPGLYGSLLADGIDHDLFLTLSPLLVGDADGADWHAPSLVQGATFLPGGAPVARPVSLRRVGAHLYLRARVTVGDPV